jgi:hypothetical protein
MMRVVLTVLLMLPLAGCGKTMATVATTDAVCADAWRPISWSPKDTDRSILEIKQNNARWKAWCRK